MNRLGSDIYSVFWPSFEARIARQDAAELTTPARLAVLAV